ncbi:hypothetical protein BS47DRAFT_1357633 [Hydnum rufescens UP504]|uniref:Uncharacterized protein n=1 Tax=Hydnum rufescens UP504 TaxID=1448309 RepID=A0A9P6BAW1_9AGAM|nr:hypothetical protein BS47DRAFT_1357633 [Hydnum rufescens UP504]
MHYFRSLTRKVGEWREPTNLLNGQVQVDDGETPEFPGLQEAMLKYLSDGTSDVSGGDILLRKQLWHGEIEMKYNGHAQLKLNVLSSKTIHCNLLNHKLEHLFPQKNLKAALSALQVAIDQRKEVQIGPLEPQPLEPLLPPEAITCWSNIHEFPQDTLALGPPEKSWGFGGGSPQEALRSLGLESSGWGDQYLCWLSFYAFHQFYCQWEPPEPWPTLHNASTIHAACISWGDWTQGRGGRGLVLGPGCHQRGDLYGRGGIGLGPQGTPWGINKGAQGPLGPLGTNFKGHTFVMYKPVADPGIKIWTS